MLSRPYRRDYSLTDYCHCRDFFESSSNHITLPFLYRKSFGVSPSGGRGSMNSKFEFIEPLPPEGETPNANVFSSFPRVSTVVSYELNLVEEGFCHDAFPSS